MYSGFLFGVGAAFGVLAVLIALRLFRGWFPWVRWVLKGIGIGVVYGLSESGKLMASAIAISAVIVGIICLFTIGPHGIAFLLGR